MDSNILLSISGVTTFLGIVDKRILGLLKTTHVENEILQDIHNSLQTLRKTLVSLSTSIKKPNFNKALLSELKTPNATLFQYTTTVLLAALNGMRKLETQIKKATGSSGKISFLSKKPKAVGIIDDDLAVFQNRLEHFSLSLSVAQRVIECDIIATTPKLHIHDVKLSVQQLTTTISELQTINLNLMHITPPKADGVKVEYVYLTDFNGIASNATELAAVATKRTDDEMTKEHSGFVPMSPLIEVLSNCTLQPCPTIASVFELEK